MTKVGFFSDKIDGNCPIGMGNIALQIAKRLQRSGDVNLSLVHHAFANHPIYSECKNIILPSFHPRRVSQYLDPFLLKQHKLSIMHYPDHNLLPLVCKPARKVVVTIHDVISSWLSEELLDRPFNKKIIYTLKHQHKIDKIVTVSEYSKKQIVKLFKVPENKLYVIPNGVDLDLFAREKKSSKEYVRKRFCIDKPFIFHVSSLRKVKNIDSILFVAKVIVETNRDLHIVLAGGFEHTKGWVEKRVRKLGIGEKVHLLGSVSNHDLICLYNSAEMFLFPSLAEGFGVPVLEAMACGCPVVASDIPPFREFANDCVLMVDPNSLEDIVSACFALLNDQGLRENLSGKGLRQAKKYCWSKITQKILGLYDELMSTPEGW